MCQTDDRTRFILGDYTSACMNRLSCSSTAMALGSRPVSARHSLSRPEQKPTLAVIHPGERLGKPA
jgi:hypothetical protein